MIRRLALLALLALAFPALGAAQSVDAIFARGNEAFLGEDYQAAIEQYERLLEAGVADPDVEFDLATAHARLGRFGPAILHFERALALRPGDDDAEAGLTAARRILAERRAAEEGVGEILEGESLTDAVYGNFTEPVLAWGLVVFELLLVLTIVWFRRSRGGLRTGLALLLVVEALGLAAFGVGVLNKRGAFREGERGIVLVDRSELREGPDPRHPERGRLREGDAALVFEADETGEFVRVRVGEHQGWAERAAVGTI